MSVTAAKKDSKYEAPAAPNPAALRAEFYALPPEAFIDRATVAACLYVTPQMLDILAIKGGGPKYTRIGRRALYCKAEVLAWAAATGRTVENTSQLAGTSPALVSRSATVTSLPAAAKRRAAAQVEA